MTYSPSGDNGGNIYPWQVYLADDQNQQVAVYQGMQLSDDMILYAFPGANLATYYPNTTNFEYRDGLFTKATAFLYPVEYNSHGAGLEMTYRPDNQGNWRKDYYINDHLGSPLVELRADENAPDLYTVRGEYMYKPFGERITLSGKQDRQGFIGKQKDREMNLADHGVRKYDDGGLAALPARTRCGRSITAGRRTSIA